MVIRLRLDATVDLYFRTWLVEGLGYGDGSKGGRPPFDPVSMFKALILQAQHNLSDAKMENRGSVILDAVFELGGTREYDPYFVLTILKRVMKAFDWQLKRIFLKR